MPMIPSLFGGPQDTPAMAFDGGDEPIHVLGLPNYWINTITRTLVVTDRIYQYRGLGPAVTLALTFNSNDHSRGSFGQGWRFSYGSTVGIVDNRILLRKGSGSVVPYHRPLGSKPGSPAAPLELAPAPGTGDRLLDYGAFWLYFPKRERVSYHYEKGNGGATGRLTAITDLYGNTVQLQYGNDGRLESLTDAAGRRTRLGSDRPPYCTTIELPDGRRAAFRYDDAGHLIEVVDLQGIATQYRYAPDHTLIQMIVGEDRKTTAISYEGTGRQARVAAVTNAAGHTTQYRMTATGTVQVVRPEGNTATYTSREGRTERITDAEGHTVDVTYQNGRLVNHTNKNGHRTSMEYDQSGNLTGIIDPESQATRFEYDTQGNLTRLIDAEGGQTTCVYNTCRQPSQITTPLGRTSRYDYDQRGQLVALTNPAGHTVRIDYDRFGNPAVLRDPIGRVYTCTYDPAGLRLVQIVHPGGNRYRFEYDNNDRMVSRVHPDGAVARYQFGCCAWTSISDENGNTIQVRRNPLMSLTDLIDPLGNTITFQYDRNNRLTRVEDPLGRATAVHYGTLNRPVAVTNAQGQTVRMSYDSLGNFTALTDERGNRTTFHYNKNNRRVRITDPLGSTTIYQRDRIGRITMVSTPTGATVAYRVDPDGREIEKTYNGVQVAAFEYDLAGNPTVVHDRTGRTEFTYDAARQMTAIRFPTGPVVTVSYDDAGTVRSYGYPKGLTVTYDYDPCRRVTRVAWDTASLSRTYDRAGNVLTEHRSNGIDTAYQYDARSRVTGIMHGPSQQPLIDLTYVYDANGNLIDESGTVPGRAKPTSPRETPPDTTSVFNAANQLIERGPDRYAYDLAGNRIGGTGTASFTATYDAENHLIEMIRNGQRVQYSYTGMGERCTRSDALSTVHYHASPNGRILFETDGAGNLRNRYIYCEGRLIAAVTPDGTTVWYHFDKTGNTLALTDAAGQVLVTYGYEPFGTATPSGELAVRNPFTYVGEFGVMDEGDGLYFMRFRFYDAHSGTFLTPDPIGFQGGLNLYAYVGNNPVTYRDPQGTDLVFCLIAGIVVAVFTTVACSALKVGADNPIPRTLKIAEQGNPDANNANAPTVTASDFFSDPDHGVEQLAWKVADKGLSYHPAFGPGWSMIQAGQGFAEGNFWDFFINTAGIYPGVNEAQKGMDEMADLLDPVVWKEIPVGNVTNLADEVVEACTVTQSGQKSSRRRQ